MTQDQKERLRNKAIKEIFFDSDVYDKKLMNMMYRYHVPNEADLFNDAKAEVLLNIAKYPLDKFIETYQDNPKRILALAITISFRRLFNQDKRTKKVVGAIPKLLFTSNIINSSEDEYCFNGMVDDEEETKSKQMWEYVFNQITPEQQQLLDKILDPRKQQLTKNQQAAYDNLLPILKQIITKYKTINQ